MHYFYGMTAIALLGLSAMAPPALANTSLEPAVVTAPFMADVLQSDPCSPASLTRLAEQMKRQVGPSVEGTGAGLEDFPLPSFLEAFLDDSGNLNLPLGLTVYNTMGDTSIGFGTTF